MSLQPHEIGQSHNDVVAHLARENRKLSASLEAMAAPAYVSEPFLMRERLQKLARGNNRDT